MGLFGKKTPQEEEADFKKNLLECIDDAAKNSTLNYDILCGIACLEMLKHFSYMDSSFNSEFSRRNGIYESLIRNAKNTFPGDYYRAYDEWNDRDENQYKVARLISLVAFTTLAKRHQGADTGLEAPVVFAQLKDAIRGKRRVNQFMPVEEMKEMNDVLRSFDMERRLGIAKIPKRVGRPSMSQPSHAQSVDILEALRLLEGLREKYRKEIVWSSDANSLRHRKVQAHEDVNAIEAYISMCKGAFEKNKSHFQDALRSLELGRGSIQSSAYPLIILCQAYLAYDNESKQRNLDAAKRASHSMQEELAKEIFELVVDEMEIDSLGARKGSRIRELVEEKQDDDEDRYFPVYDEAEAERAKERYRTFLEKAMERRERTFYALMDSLKSRNPSG